MPVLVKGAVRKRDDEAVGPELNWHAAVFLYSFVPVSGSTTWVSRAWSTFLASQMKLRRFREPSRYSSGSCCS